MADINDAIFDVLKSPFESSDPDPSEDKRKRRERMLKQGKRLLKCGIFSVILGLGIGVYLYLSEGKSGGFFFGIPLIIYGVTRIIIGVLYPKILADKNIYNRTRTYFKILSVLFILAPILLVILVGDNFSNKMLGNILGALLLALIFVGLALFRSLPHADILWCKFCGEKNYEWEEVSRTLVRRYKKTEEQEYEDSNRNKRVKYIPLIVEDWNIVYRHNCCNSEYEEKKTLTINAQTGGESWSK